MNESGLRYPMLTAEQRQLLRLVLHRLRAVQSCLLEATTKADRMVLRNELLMLQLELDRVLDREQDDPT